MPRQEAVTHPGHGLGGMSGYTRRLPPTLAMLCPMHRARLPLAWKIAVSRPGGLATLAAESYPSSHLGGDPCHRDGLVA